MGRTETCCVSGSDALNTLKQQFGCIGVSERFGMGNRPRIIAIGAIYSSTHPILAFLENSIYHNIPTRHEHVFPGRAGQTLNVWSAQQRRTESFLTCENGVRGTVDGAHKRRQPVGARGDGFSAKKARKDETFFFSVIIHC